MSMIDTRRFVANGNSGAIAVTGPGMLLHGVVTGAGAVAAAIQPQVSNLPADDSAWIDYGPALVLSGTTRAQGQVAVPTSFAFARLVVTGLSSGAVLNTGLSSLSAAQATGYGGKPLVSINRPADVAPYVANDVVGASTAAGGAIWRFPNMGPPGGVVSLQSLDFGIDNAALPTGMGAFRAMLYSASPPSALGDNAAWSMSAADWAVRQGYIDIPQPTLLGGKLNQQADQIGRTVRLADDGSLYAYLVTLAGYTPASGTAYSMAPGGAAF